MSNSRQFAGSTVALGVVALAHALLTWPLGATLAFFGGGALVAFVAEAVVISLGWLDHHIGPKLLGVPLYVLFGWTGTIYVAFRVALLVTGDWSVLGTEGLNVLGIGDWTAVVAAALLATTFDVLTDHRGVEEGYWTYTDDLPGPRWRSVPWWNFAGWLAISALTAGFAVPFL